ncbi:MAG TPA: hypothetical protein PLK82_02690, partial [Bacteroidales bacterium]|nr:hypothetical protein [Bacteroidales bacterium]
NKLLLLLCLLPAGVFGQKGGTVGSRELEKTYVQAIGDFINAANAMNPAPFDTLWFGNRKDGLPDDFPDINLPREIERTQIRLITPAEGEKSQKQRPSRIYINLVGWVDRAKAEFMFVVFSAGFRHQYDYHLTYLSGQGESNWKLDKLERKGPPFK